MGSIKPLASNPGGCSIHRDKAKRVISGHQRKGKGDWCGGNRQRCRDGIQGGDGVHGETEKVGKHDRQARKKIGTVEI
jgi:hypothetical protein